MIPKNMTKRISNPLKILNHLKCPYFVGFENTPARYRSMIKLRDKH